MYYEEKMIDGILYWRDKPDGTFKLYTLKELSAEVVGLREKKEILRNKVKKLKKELDVSRS